MHPDELKREIWTSFNLLGFATYATIDASRVAWGATIDPKGTIRGGLG